VRESQELAAHFLASAQVWQHEDASVVFVRYVAPDDVSCAYDKPYWVVSSLTPAAEMRAEGAQRASWVTVAVDSGHSVVMADAIAYAVKPDEVLVTVAWVNSV
jgi:hypothetical protein